MAEFGPDTCLERILALPGDGRWGIDTAHAIRGVTAFAVRSFDGDALLFSLPLIVRRPLLSEIPLDDVRGAAGAVALCIEQIKQRASRDEGLGPLVGRGTRFPHQYASLCEPYTLVASPAALASDLWHAGDRNYADNDGIHLLLSGAVPCPPVFTPDDITRVTDTAARLCDAVAARVFSLPVRVLEAAWITTLDQQVLRDMLPSLGLVSFIGDGARLARHCTRYRCFFRTAGPKEGVSIPFECPQELVPLELELAASNRTVTGLGIRKREVFAVAGSNAQGKTTFLDGIIAGMDDHAAGDGRELVVTVHGLHTAEATNCLLAGADVSMFFSALPPGMEGTVQVAYGMGSGSMTMARQVQEAVVRGAPLLIIDEDRAAPNLLVRSCLQTGEITPLSEILANDRGRMGETALVFAACAMDTLVAQADRIMVLERHAASAIDRETFRRTVAESLVKMAGDLR
jgi:predicted ABC-class ATPase